MRHGFVITLLFLAIGLYAQKTEIHGTITDEKGAPMPYATVKQNNTNHGTISNDNGDYRLLIPMVDQEVAIVFESLNHYPDTVYINPRGKSKINIDKQMSVNPHVIDPISISERHQKGKALKNIGVSSYDYLPTSSGNIEDLIMTQPGTRSSSELSSQYSVRGGNYDENLVYVNDIEIYRPLLIRSGQQEGLSFVNPDLVRALKFSGGGFEPRYGDKMSSVLDIKYKKPKKFAGGAGMSMLGGNAFVQSASRNNKFSQISGIRYKTSRYLLGSLDATGEYRPSFIDFQTYLNYNFSEKTSISFLGNFSQNKYTFVPETQLTEFGTFQNALGLKVFYEGQELDYFNTTFGALTLNHEPSKDINLKFITSAFNTNEHEGYDILGQYLINVLDQRFDSESFGDSAQNIGVGSFLNHARNDLSATVLSVQHIGSSKQGDNEIKWGINYQREIIVDDILEWELIDSAGYTLPYSDNSVDLWTSTTSNNDIQSNRIKAFIQQSFQFGDQVPQFLTLGARLTYWDLNGEYTFDPRLYYAIEPNWKRDFLFNFAAGLYSQPPFYKELRRPDGSLNYSIKPQKSAHFVLGSDFNFFAFTRLFKFTTEIYYKYMWDLIPYKVDNVRINYSAENNAKGYATGIDFKVSGEFVPGADSWLSLSFMQTREDQQNDFNLTDNGEREEIGYYPRPTDQLMNFGLFFQDYLPMNPSYKVHLNFIYGSRLPIHVPHIERYDQVFRMPPYRRVDIGFSKVLKQYGQLTGNVFDNFESIWLTAEIFNLFGVNNTISYLWIKTVSSIEGVPGFFAVPNFLTGRRFNVKLTMKF